MTGSQKASLEEKARSVLSDHGMPDITVADPRIGRPTFARLEIVHPSLSECRPSERWERMKAMTSDGTGAAVVLELAQMTRALRDGGIRATADYGLGTIVVGWGRPRKPDIDEIKRSLAGRSGGEPVPEDLALITWAARPPSEADALTSALSDAVGAISPAYAAGTRGAAGNSRRDRPDSPGPTLHP